MVTSNVVQDGITFDLEAFLSSVMFINLIMGNPNLEAWSAVQGALGGQFGFHHQLLGGRGGGHHVVEFLRRDLGLGLARQHVVVRRNVHDLEAVLLTEWNGHLEVG